MNMTFEKNTKLTAVIGKECKLLKPKSCHEWYQSGKKKNGVYEIDVNGNSTKVFCDMKDGGWTVFQKSVYGCVDFTRTWEEYKNGFGDADGDYWLGNNVIHQLTSKPADGIFIKIKTTNIAGESKYIVFDWIQSRQ